MESHIASRLLGGLGPSDRDRVVHHYVTVHGCDPEDVTVVTDLDHLGELGGMPDRPGAALLLTSLWERDLIDWISDQHGGVCWATRDDFDLAVEHAIDRAERKANP